MKPMKTLPRPWQPFWLPSSSWMPPLAAVGLPSDLVIELKLVKMRDDDGI